MERIAMNSPSHPPAQSQSRQPGQQRPMEPAPETIRADYRGSGKLKDRIAVVAGGDSGIGRAAAVHFAREGANVVIVYLDEDKDAEDTRRMVSEEGRHCHAIRSDLSHPEEAKRVVRQVMEMHGRIDVLVHSVAQQYPQSTPEDISPEQLQRTFATNVFSAFFLVGAALPHMGAGGAIVLTGSVNGVRGNKKLMDYAATKGAIHNFAYSLASSLAQRGIRVNVVAPGPIWTPLIPSSFEPSHVEKFGSNTLLGRAGQPSECGPAYVYLASDDSSYVTGQIVHVNGGGFIGD
jgi:NAD(P)-dependent dehydrogenase (short-subunit alcohol dehydrogenase family)